MKRDASLSPIRSLWVGLLAVLFTTLLAAAEPASLRITQVLTQGTDITAYVAVRDESGGVVSSESLLQAKATLGPHVAEVVSAQPFAATGEGVLYIFLVDISRSLDNTQFDRLRKALKDWVAAMGENDRAAILAFGEQVRTLVAPTADKAALKTAIEGLSPKDNRTALHQALAQGLTLGQQTGGDLPSRRAMVILSDGQDDAPGGMTAEEVDQRFAEAAVPIYAIGFSKGRDRAAREAGLAALGRFARRSGGLFVDASAGDPGAAYADMREIIRSVDRMQLKCADCTPDGNRYRLQIALTQAGRTQTDGVDLRLYPTTSATTPPAAHSPAPSPSIAPAAESPPAQAPSADATPPASVPIEGPASTTPPAPGLRAFFSAWWPWLVAGGAILVILIIYLVARRSPQPVPEPVQPTAPVAGGAILPQAQPVAPPPEATRCAPPAPSGPTLTLAFMNGPRRGESAGLVMAPEVVVGRAAACTLTLTGDDEVSGRHARFYIHNRRLLLEDLGSTNGTWLNGVRLAAPSPLSPGDVVQCGQTELRFTGIGHQTSSVGEGA